FKVAYPYIKEYKEKGPDLDAITPAHFTEYDMPVNKEEIREHINQYFEYISSTVLGYANDDLDLESLYEVAESLYAIDAINTPVETLSYDYSKLQTNADAVFKLIDGLNSDHIISTLDHLSPYAQLAFHASLRAGLKGYITLYYNPAEKIRQLINAQ